MSGGNGRKPSHAEQSPGGPGTPCSGRVSGHLGCRRGEAKYVESRLENHYQALETKQLPIAVLSPRILSLKSRQDQLAVAKEEAEGQLEQQRAELPTNWEITGYVADFCAFFRKAPSRSGRRSSVTS